jgi:putative spermidine/putrescine transport system permease protein
VGLGLVVGATALALLAPIMVVFPLSFTSRKSFIFPPNGYSGRWYQSFFTDPQWVYSFYDSIIVAVATSIVATVVGTAACFGIRRLRTKLQFLVVGLLLLPVVVPVVITGVGIYAVFLKWGLVGTYPGFVLAHTLYALPLVVVPVMTSLSTFDSTLERAAGSLGATKWNTFRQVTLPAILPGVAAGAVFAFVQSWDEIVISIFVSTPGLTTLPVRMYNAVAADVDPTLAAASSLVITVVTLAILGTFVVGSRRRRLNAAAAAS